MNYEPWASSPAARRAMQGNRSRDTKPELAVRRLIHAAGLRYRVDVRPKRDLPRRADIMFTRQRIAVFIDGCYWHGCEQHVRVPSKANADYWNKKLARNVERDTETTALLEQAGWRVLRYWEHEAPESVAESIVRAVRRTAAG
ncbi:MAG: very short patch repair endonuclease [Actinomycetota bacterium]